MQYNVADIIYAIVYENYSYSYTSFMTCDVPCMFFPASPPSLLPSLPPSLPPPPPLQANGARALLWEWLMCKDDLPCRHPRHPLLGPGVGGGPHGAG